jgi:transcriptional regulator with XRE-family HTH domain
MLTASDIQARLRAQKAADGLTDAQLAARYGVVQSYMSKLLAGDTPPGEKILRQLGLRKVVHFVPAEPA